MANIDGKDNLWRPLIYSNYRFLEIQGTVTHYSFPINFSLNIIQNPYPDVVFIIVSKHPRLSCRNNIFNCQLYSIKGILAQLMFN